MIFVCDVQCYQCIVLWIYRKIQTKVNEVLKAWRALVEKLMCFWNLNMLVKGCKSVL